MESSRDSSPEASLFRVLAVTQGSWGERIADNLRTHAPADWVVAAWAAPRVIPPVVDSPEDYLPPGLPPADLVLSLGEVPGLAQLIPDVVRMVGARAVIAPIDRNESLPPGLVRQLRGWLEGMGVSCAFPKPFCSLTEESYNRTPQVVRYDDPWIRRFAKAFGRPIFKAKVVRGRMERLEVVRDAACGCARHVAQGLTGTPVDGSIEAAGMLHHHYPCLASMNKDPDYQDTLMHVSGHFLQDALKDIVRPYLTPTPYLRPHNLVEQETAEEDAR